MAIIGGGRLTPIHWLRVGLSQARRVGKLRIRYTQDGQNRDGLVTGFMVDGALIHQDLRDMPLVLTNYHALPDNTNLRECTIEFEGMFDDTSETITTHVDNVIWHSPSDELDIALILMSHSPGFVEPLAISPTSPRVDDRVFVISYPAGGGLAFSQDDNVVVGISEKDIFYTASTLPGSSGAPVFNAQWEVVAIHHTGGWLMVEGKQVFANAGTKMPLIMQEIRQSLTEKDFTSLVATHKQNIKRRVGDNYFSVFISYSHADAVFARRLYNELQSRGIRCWQDEHEIPLGGDVYTEIARGIRHWDKVLLCASRNSLTSWWVDNELDLVFEKERQLMKERGEKVLALIPLDLDGYLFESWESGKAQQVRSRLAADFVGWESDSQKFSEQIEVLFRALAASDAGRKPLPVPKL